MTREGLPRVGFVGVGVMGHGMAACLLAAGYPLTVTDVNLLLGRLVPSRFPIPIDLLKPILELQQEDGEPSEGGS